MDIEVVKKNPENFTKQLQTFEKSVKHFEQQQKKLVKENPFIEIVDNKTYELAKKNRTALLKGRTGLQAQEKDIKNVVNNIKSYTSEKIKNLIEITLPAEQKQQEEVKKYEEEREKKRLAKEKEAEEIRKKAIEEIDVVFEVLDGKIERMSLKDISEIEVIFEQVGSTEVPDELQIYFDSKLKTSQNNFASKEEQLSTQKELHENKQKNRLLELTNNWSSWIFESTADNITAINQKFDKEIPSLNADDFEPFQESFNETVKSLRSKLTNKTASLQEELKRRKSEEKKKEQEEAERMAAKAIRHNIVEKYNDAKEAIKNLPLYGYEETIQIVEEKILLLETEGNNIEFLSEVNEKKEALQNALKLRIIDIKDEVKKREEEKQKQEEAEKAEAKKREEEEEKRTKEHKEFLEATEKDFAFLLDTISRLNLKTEFLIIDTSEGKKCIEKISTILDESKEDMITMVKSIMRR